MYNDELEKRIAGIEARLSKLEDALLRGGPQTTLDNLEARLVENASKINTQEMILISLRIKDKQTREQIKKSLQEWGKVYGNWFDGGNFNGRLLKKNIVRKGGIDDSNHETYTLTKRGEFLADELIAKVKRDG
ncbi:MAG TPA: hypothetical protein VH621_07380 [Nitrososphaera sp.]